MGGGDGGLVGEIERSNELCESTTPGLADRPKNNGVGIVITVSLWAHLVCHGSLSRPHLVGVVPNDSHTRAAHHHPINLNDYWRVNWWDND